MLWLSLVAVAVEGHVEELEFAHDAEVNHVVRVGDVDRDGYDDVVLRTDYGPVWVPGGPFGPEPEHARRFKGLDGATLTRHDDVAAVGDQNGDGYPDLAVTHQGYADGGAVLLFLGGASGPSATPWRRATGVAARVVRALGDLNGDRITDFGAWTPKGLFVYRGGGSRLVHESFLPLTGIARDVATFNDLEGMSSDLLLVGFQNSHNEVWVAARTGTWTWSTPRLIDRLPYLPYDTRPIATDGRYNVGYLLTSGRAHTWSTGFAGVVPSSYGACYLGMCGWDIAVFDTGRGPRVLVATTASLHVLEPTGPGVDLGFSIGLLIENVGDVDGDGVADLVGWGIDSPRWSFVSGDQLGLW